MKKVLVLGGSGFIGRALVQKLIDLDYEVTAVDRYWNEKPFDVNCITGDVFDEACLDDVMINQEVVFHLVSTTVPATSNKSPVFDCETNTIGSLKVLDAMVKHKVGKIIFASSGGTVYGVPKTVPILESAPNFPISAYGISKVAVEKYINLYSYLYNIQGVSLRLSNPYGPGQDPEKGQGVIGAFVKRALLDEPIEIWGDGSVVRDFIYIDDVVDAFIQSLVLQESFSLFNIGSGEGQSLLQVLSAIEKSVGKKVCVRHKDSRACDVPEVILDVKKAARCFGWKPKYSFENGLSKTVYSHRSQI